MNYSLIWLWFIMVKSRPQRAWRNHIYKAGSWVTYRHDNCYWVVCRWEEGEGVGVFSQWGRWGKTSVQTSYNRFLKTLTEVAVATERGSLFQYLTTLTENADPLLRRWLAPWSTLKGCPLRPRRVGGRKNKLGSIPKRPLNILNIIIMLNRAIGLKRARWWKSEELETFST